MSAQITRDLLGDSWRVSAGNRRVEVDSLDDAISEAAEVLFVREDTGWRPLVVIDP